MSHPYRIVIAAAITLGLFALWAYGIDRLMDFGFVPPVPGFWPVSMGSVNPKLVYYAAVAATWLGLTVLGVWSIRKLIRQPEYEDEPSETGD